MASFPSLLFYYQMWWIISLFIYFSFQIPQDEYTEALKHLMREPKIRCHMWCYNMPLAIIFFTVFLGLCLALIPIIESSFLFDGSQLGMEYLHGAVVWLCVLTVYMFMNHISRRKVRTKYSIMLQYLFQFYMAEIFMQEKSIHEALIIEWLPI